MAYKLTEKKLFDKSIIICVLLLCSSFDILQNMAFLPIMLRSQLLIKKILKNT